MHWFENLTDAKENLQAWQDDYNENRPHRVLNELSPIEFRVKWTNKNQNGTEVVV